MLRRPPRSTRPYTLFPYTTLFRSRQGRAWASPAGNLYVSTIVRLRPTDPPAATLALVAAVAVEETVRLFLDGELALKWPNDLLLGGAKPAGVLLERADDDGIHGFGVNLDRKSTRLNSSH